MIQTGPVVNIDIVSDVMCPWCIIGFRQLEQALGATGTGARIRWQPFELNPDMPPEGQTLTEHVTQKYGINADQSAANRQQMESLGKSLGINFNWTDDSRIVNSFAAHQLLDWALEQDKQHPLKLALFDAHFGAGRDVSDPETLIDIAGDAGLPTDTARDVLETGSHAERVRQHEHFWTSRGISGVPSMIFDGKFLLTGAQGAETYAQVLKRAVAEQNAPVTG